MSSLNFSRRDHGPPSAGANEAWDEFAAALAHERRLREDAEEVLYFQDRARREMDLAARAADPRAEAIHLALAHGYRERAELLRPPPEVLSWLDEGGAYLPSD